MKKLTALCCVLCTLCLLTGALAAPGDAYLFTDDQREELGITEYNTPTMAAVGDTVYTLWGTTIFAWQTGTDTPVPVASDLAYDKYSTYEDAQKLLGDDAEKVITLLLSNNETLYSLNALNGYLYPLTFADGQAAFGTPITLDWDAIEDIQNDNDYMSIVNACIAGNALYLLVRTDNDYDNPSLMVFDLASGGEETLDVSHVQDITPYVDGKLLLEIYDMENTYDAETEQTLNPTLSVYDPADSSVTQAGTFGSSNLSGIAYYAENDTLYYATNSLLMAMPSLGEATQVAYIPVDYTSDVPACVLPGGLYAIDMWSGMIVRNVDPSYMPTTTLSIYGGYLNEAGTAFMAQYPDVPLTFDQDVYFESASALAQAMVSGDSSFDLYFFDIGYQDFETLMEKGYCLALTPYASLTEGLSTLYPFIQDAIAKDGVYYAVPTYLYSNGLSINPDVWEEAGLTDRIPTSFMGLIDFISWWTDEGMDEYPDLQLFQDAYDYGDTLFYLALDLYVDQYQAEGKDLTLDTPEFRAMMEGLESLDIDVLNDSIPVQDDDDMSYSYDEYMSNCLFCTYGDWLSTYAYDDNSEPLVLPIEDGGATWVPAYINCVFINPNTENPDMAAAYLQCVLDNLDASERVALFPDDNDPVPNEYFEQMVTEYESMLADAKASLETAAPEDAKDIQTSIDSYQSFLDNKDNYYWNVSAESIAAYRKMAEQCYAATPNILNYSGNDEASSEIYSLIERYTQKQITLDQFITQAEQKIRMIQLEMQ